MQVSLYIIFILAFSLYQVLQDPSLSPLLETWGSKTTVELMEEIFPNSKSQRRGSGQLDDR